MNHSESSATTKENSSGFTILELLVVVAIIAILAGLILSTAGYIQNRVARSRAEGEVAGMETALENYKADMGEYPAWTNGTPTTTAAPPSTLSGSNVLVLALSPTSSNTYNPQKKIFYTFPSSMLTNNSSTNQILDPFGNSYGYLCPGTYNTASYDLWSTAGSTNTNLWIKNW